MAGKILLIVLLGLLLLSGCHAQQQIDTSTMSDKAKVDILETKEKLVYIYETNKLAVSFYIALAASVLMIIQRVKFGWGLLGASIIGLVAIRLDQALAATYQWAYLVVAALVAVGIVFFVWDRYIRDKADVEIVDSVQKFFKDKPEWEAFKEYAKGGGHSKTTHKIVKEVKAKEK